MFLLLGCLGLVFSSCWAALVWVFWIWILFVLIVGLFRYILTDLIYVLCLFHTMSSFDIFKAQAEALGLEGAEIGRYVV